MPTTTLSNREDARRTKSWCPSVIGSNVPGYTALIIGLPCKKVIMDVPGPRAPQRLPAARRVERRRALYVDASPRGEDPAHQSQRREMKAQAIRRVDEHDVESRTRFPGEF